MLNSIRSRLTAWHVALLGAILILFSVLLYFFLSKRLHEGIDNSLMVSASVVRKTADTIEVLTRCREKKINTPILLLTAKDSVEDKVTGLNKGADDYLTKPFAFSELLARIRSLLRRGQSETKTVLSLADLSLDMVSHKVNRNGEEIELTGKEYSLLEYFIRNQGKVLTRTMIAEHVWDYNFDTFTNVIDVYINHLRKKIDKDHPKKLLHTLRGVGYVLKE